MVIKDWHSKQGESIYEKYSRFLTEVVKDDVDCYVYNNQMIIDVVDLIGANQMYVRLVKRKPELTLDMLMYRKGVTSKILFSCEPEPVIVMHSSAKIMVDYILTFSQLGRSEVECLAYAMHMLVSL